MGQKFHTGLGMSLRVENKNPKRTLNVVPLYERRAAGSVLLDTALHETRYMMCVNTINGIWTRSIDMMHMFQ